METKQTKMFLISKNNDNKSVFTFIVLWSAFIWHMSSVWPDRCCYIAVLCQLSLYAHCWILLNNHHFVVIICQFYHFDKVKIVRWTFYFLMIDENVENFKFTFIINKIVYKLENIHIPYTCPNKSSGTVIARK